MTRLRDARLVHEGGPAEEDASFPVRLSPSVVPVPTSGLPVGQGPPRPRRVGVKGPCKPAPLTSLAPPLRCQGPRRRAVGRKRRASAASGPKGLSTRARGGGLSTSAGPLRPCHCPRPRRPPEGCRQRPGRVSGARGHRREGRAPRPHPARFDRTPAPPFFPIASWGLARVRGLRPPAERR